MNIGTSFVDIGALIAKILILKAHIYLHVGMSKPELWPPGLRKTWSTSKFITETNLDLLQVFFQGTSYDIAREVFFDSSCGTFVMFVCLFVCFVMFVL